MGLRPTSIIMGANQNHRDIEFTLFNIWDLKTTSLLDWGGGSVGGATVGLTGAGGTSVGGTTSTGASVATASVGAGSDVGAGVVGAHAARNIARIRTIERIAKYFRSHFTPPYKLLESSDSLCRILLEFGEKLCCEVSFLPYQQVLSRYH